MNALNMWIIPFQDEAVNLSQNTTTIRDLEYPDARRNAYKGLSQTVDISKFRDIVSSEIGRCFVINGDGVNYAVMLDESEVDHSKDMSLEYRTVQDIFRVLVSKSLGKLDKTGYFTATAIRKSIGTNVDRVLKFLDIVNNGTLDEYKGNKGQIKMAEKLGGKIHLGHLYSLASGLGKVGELGWTLMNVPYEIARKFEELLKEDTTGIYKGNKGQIKMAEKLGGKIKIHLGQLYSLASGLGKVGELEWTIMNVPYEMVGKFVVLLEEDKIGIYKGNKGQIKMAEKLGGMNLGHLYSLASGLGMVGELGWTRMNVPYEIARKFEELLKEDTTRIYKGNKGQIKMAEKLGKMNLVHLYSLASGLGMVGELGWTIMHVPYEMVGQFERYVSLLICEGKIDTYVGFMGRYRFAIEFGYNIYSLLVLSEVYDFDNILNWRRRAKAGTGTVKRGISFDTYGSEAKGLHESIADKCGSSQEDQFLEQQINVILKNIVAGVDLKRNIFEILKILEIEADSQEGKAVVAKLTKLPESVLELFQY